MKNLSSRFVVPIMAILLVVATMATAETLYVTDELQITFRSGPGNDRKILSLLNSDQPVDILETQDKWVRVSLPDGKEGWVLRQYLTADIPCRTRITSVSQSLSELKSQLSDVQKAHRQVEAAKKELEKDLNKTRQELTETDRAYEKLKTDAAGFLELKAKYEKTEARLSKQQQRADTLELALNSLSKKRNFWWFLGGGGVLLSGFILGFSTKRQKRHSSLL